MPERLVATLNPVRMDTYRAEWARQSGVSPSAVSPGAVASLYVWQVSLGAAWFETLAYTEAVVRHSIDTTLRRWNRQQGRSEDWLNDTVAPLRSLVQKTNGATTYRANEAKARRAPTHPRHGAPVTLDDRVSQLEFGQLVRLLPQKPPSQRSHNGSGFSGPENLWIHGLKAAFPRLSPELTSRWQSQLPTGLPVQVQDAYGVGLALERLRRLRNRVFHHEQILRVEHTQRLKDVTIILRSIDSGAVDGLKRLDTVRRTLALRPQP